jgi:cytochrome c biogenesis protein CcdA
MIAALLTATWLGLLTAISPCPLATNIAAVSYLGRHAEAPGRALRSGLAYILGRVLCYTALAAALSAGLLAATTASEVVSRAVGLIIGPLLLIAGAMLLGLVPAPSLGGAAGGLTEKLGRRGDALGGLLLGVAFTLSFCPTSAALFFGSLIPLAAKSESAILVPATFAVATGLPVLLFAILIASGGHGLGKAFDRLRTVEAWFRALTGLALLGVGLFLCVKTNFGL